MNPTVQVKPLVWIKHFIETPWGDRHWWTGHASTYSTPILFTVTQSVDWYLKTTIMPDNHSTHSSLDAAQAAAQTEWDSFIQSAIEPIPYDTRN